MRLLDLFTWPTPNPDVVGIVRLSRDEIDPAAIEAHHRKLRRARAYLRLRKISIRPVCGVKR